MHTDQAVRPTTPKQKKCIMLIQFIYAENSCSA